MDTASSKKIKLSVKPENDMKKPLSKINVEPDHNRTMFCGPVVYSEDLKHINPQDAKAVDWEKKGVNPKPGNALANYKPSATAITMIEKEHVAIAPSERERVAKRTAEKAFDQVLTLSRIN